MQYAYDGHRLAAIEHLRAPGTGERLLRLDYEYDARDLPWRITEYGAGPVSTPTVQAVSTFTHDRRGRLTGEARRYFPNPGDATQNYDLEYGYDAGGNRTVKVDGFNDRRVEYHYDLENPSLYGSNNNRLMWYETINTAPNPEVTLSEDVLRVHLRFDGSAERQDRRQRDADHHGASGGERCVGRGGRAARVAWWGLP